MKYLETFIGVEAGTTPIVLCLRQGGKMSAKEIIGKIRARLRLARGMKLGVCLICTSDTRELSDNLKTLRKYARFINVVIDVSDEEVASHLHDLMNERLLDSVTKVSGKKKDLTRPAMWEAGLISLKSSDCTHFLLLDENEHIKPENLIAAKKRILYTGAEVSFIEEYDLAKTEAGEKLANAPRQGMIPFIGKLDNETLIDNFSKAPVKLAGERYTGMKEKASFFIFNYPIVLEKRLKGKEK